MESTIREKCTPGVHSTHIFPHWTQVKYRQITGKRSLFLYIKHISLTVVFVEIPDVDQNGLSKVPDHKPENKVLDLGKKNRQQFCSRRIHDPYRNYFLRQKTANNAQATQRHSLQMFGLNTLWVWFLRWQRIFTDWVANQTARKTLSTVLVYTIKNRIHSFIHSFVHSFICSFVRSFIHSFAHSWTLATSKVQMCCKSFAPFAAWFFVSLWIIPWWTMITSCW